MDKKLSVILINYKNWEDTAECIRSLLDAQIDLQSILVIDNGSENNSCSELRKCFPHMILLESKQNIGFSGGNNWGISRAVSEGFEYVVLLNNDTLVSKDAIHNLIYGMDQHPEVSLGTGQIRWFPDTNRIWYAGGRLIPWRGLAVHNYFGQSNTKFVSNNPEEVSFISGCFMCIRTSVINNLGLLNEKFFIYLEDIEYSARAQKKNLVLMYFPESLIYHKWRGETELKNNTLYYAVRNRLLLIDLAFSKIAKVYFLSVISLKIIYWFISNRTLSKAGLKGLSDYRKGYFGEIR